MKKPIDSLKLSCVWNESLLPKSAVLKVTIEGLLLQGSAFVDYSLSPLPTDAPSLLPLPPCIFAFISMVKQYSFLIYLSFYFDL